MLYCNSCEKEVKTAIKNLGSSKSLFCANCGGYLADDYKKDPDHYNEYKQNHVNTNPRHNKQNS